MKKPEAMAKETVKKPEAMAKVAVKKPMATVKATVKKPVTKSEAAALHSALVRVEGSKGTKSEKFKKDKRWQMCTDRPSMCLMLDEVEESFGIFFDALHSKDQLPARLLTTIRHHFTFAC